MFFNYLIFYKRQINIPSQHVYKNLFVYCFFLLDQLPELLQHRVLVPHFTLLPLGILRSSRLPLSFPPPLHTESQVLKNYKKTFFLHSSKAFAQLIIVWYHCKCERVRVSLAHHLSLASYAVHRHDYIQHGGVGNLKFAHFGLLSCI